MAGYILDIKRKQHMVHLNPNRTVLPPPGIKCCRLLSNLLSHSDENQVVYMYKNYIMKKFFSIFIHNKVIIKCRELTQVGRNIT